MNLLSRWLRRLKPVAAPTEVEMWLSKSLLYYPQLRLDIEGSFVSYSPQTIAPGLVSRIQAAYQLAMDRFGGVGDSVWRVFSERSRNVHESLLGQGIERITRILEDPIPTRLFEGYYSVTRDLNIDEDSSEARELREWAVHQTYECFVRLAHATGATRLWNPERPQPERDGTASVTSAGFEGLLAALDREIGIRIDFPNPLPREFGLLSSRGIASYRPPHAIYQAWRTQKLLQETGGAKVLEIGAGMGRNAYYAKRLGSAEFTIVDLPLANVAQANFLGRVLGPEAIWLPGDPVSDQTGRIRICPSDWLANSDEKFDVILNVDSVTEMDSQHAVDYLRQISRRATSFLSINHEANPISVRELLFQCGVKARTLRYPYWLRRGYVEEICFF